LKFPQRGKTTWWPKILLPDSVGLVVAKTLLHKKEFKLHEVFQAAGDLIRLMDKLRRT